MTDRVGVLAQLVRAMARDDLQIPVALRLCRACAQITAADGGAITLAYTRPERVTLCATDDAAARLEDLQDVIGQGPGPEAFDSGRTVVATLDGDAPERWLMLNERARAVLGFVATVYALPIRPETEVLGVLTLYQNAPRGLAHGVDAARFLADALGAALLQDPDSQSEMSPGPWAARAQIHQATGAVMAQLHVGAEDALVLLRAHAYAHDTRLDAIAAEVIRRELDFGSTDTTGNEVS